ncbi:transcriptional regulator [Pseudomonas jessenii]|uniref:Predicted ATPase n=1 Tax=Pseudomonas jessenii TaxID=77298 RepID=A0A231GPL0_PSEJE|nr:AAA family ATPase [Pseudomonas jessenii]OXR38557.1 transcriptional regulator [Pseudomonas jessenii]SEC12231.1 Predicted ATPase [Pseudomonas jessenii]
MARPQPHPNPVLLCFVEFELDESNACLSRNGQAVALAPTPFTLLCVLARQPGSLVTKDALLDAVWGHRFVSDSVLKTAISDLRKVLGDDPRHPRFIETVSRRGYRFIASPSSALSMPPASATATAASTPSSPSFIGRTDEVARLQRAWERANGGERAVVWLAGEPGIGKTTLIEHFLANLGDIACARGHCVEHYGAGEPYLPVLEALADLCRSDPTLPALLRAVAPTWLLQLPWLSTPQEKDALRRELAGVGPDRMLREMGELLDRYTEQRPLMLVTEDLHWSDRATVQLINYVARRRGRTRLMWLSSFRLAEVVALEHPLSSLRHELRLQRLYEEVVLDPFSEIEVADYVALRSTSLARDEAFVRALHERTDGVPLFVSSITSEVMDPKDDKTTIQARLANLAVPENLAAIIDHYIARLGPEQRTLLTAAAVCGTEFRVETVSLALERDHSSVTSACEELMRAQVWLTQSRTTNVEETIELPYSFRHALFRQVLYDRTPRSLRTQLHRQVGAALERDRTTGLPVAASELAMHFDRARLPMIALRYYAEAAEAALLHFSPDLCIGLTERALVLLMQAPEGTERNSLEITLATLQGVSAFHVFGVGSEAKSAFERAYRLLADVPEHPMRGRLLHGFGYLLGLRGDYALALEVAERAEALSCAANDQELMLAACIVQGEVHHLQGRTKTTRRWLERALAIAEPLDIGTNEVFAADPQVMLHGMLAIELVRSGLLEQARVHLQQARVRAQKLRQPMTWLVAAWQEVLIEVRMGNHVRVAALADDMQALVDEYSLALGRTACRWWRGWADARRGSPSDGYLRIREAYEEHTGLGMRSGASEVLGYAAEALLLAGDCNAAQVELQEAFRVGEELGERVYLPQLLLLQAAISRAQGRPDAGIAAVRRAVEETRAQEAPWLELQALVELCEHPDATAEDLQALATLIDQLPETDGTELAKRARTLILAAKPA